MRVWIDISNSPQVLFFRPLVALLHERGHEVQVTTREYAQTIELLELHGIAHEVVGPGHGGAGVIGKGRATAGRLHALRGFVKRRDFDIALSHASHELPLVARSLGIPSSYAFDYEFARVQHGLGCRAARRVIVPDAIPQDRLDRLGASRAQGAALSGPQGGVLPPRLRSPTRPSSTSSGSTRDACSSWSALLPRSRCITATETRCSPTFSSGSARDEAVHAVVLPRTPEQRDEILARGLPSLVVPEQAIDAQSLVALADLVVSAGGTMNREAVALGIPVYTTFAGRLGAVDSALVKEGRLRVLTSADELELEKREDAARRDRTGSRAAPRPDAVGARALARMSSIRLGSRPSDEGGET